jgi:transposase InsO family protein
MPKNRSGYNNVCVFVCRLSKKLISIPCYKDVTARDMARLFIEHVYRHHGAPDSIVSDRGPQFISEFWTELCRILDIKLKLSTAGHPEIDG